MKKIIKLLAMTLSFSTMAMLTNNASAHGGYGHRGGHGDYWVGPAIIGGLITYSIMQPRPVYAPQPTVYVQTVPVPPAPIVAQNLPPVWYYCQSSQTYYPYTNNCYEGWKIVPATPQ